MILLDLRLVQLKKNRLIEAGAVQAGDVLIGLPSSGIHSNGFSLVRKIYFKDHAYTLDSFVEPLGKTLGEVLLEPTRIYVKPVLEVLKKHEVHGISHVTGGGFVENLPRMLTDDLAVEIVKGSWPILPIFDHMREIGNLKEDEMYEIFNMGIGLVLAVPEIEADAVLAAFDGLGEQAYRIGTVTEKQDLAVRMIEGAKQ